MNRKLTKKELLRVMSKRFKNENIPNNHEEQPDRDNLDGSVNGGRKVYQVFNKKGGVKVYHS